MTMIKIMVINYNKDSGLGFSYISYLTLARAGLRAKEINI